MRGRKAKRDTVLKVPSTHMGNAHGKVAHFPSKLFYQQPVKSILINDIM